MAKGKKKSTLAGNVGSDGQFHYFALALTVNADKTVSMQISELNPLPAGFILKDFDIIKRDSAHPLPGTPLGSPWGLGPSQSVDVRTFNEWNGGAFTDPSPITENTTYNMTGSAGIPEQVSSGDPVGTAIETAIF